MILTKYFHRNTKTDAFGRLPTLETVKAKLRAKLSNQDDMETVDTQVPDSSEIEVQNNRSSTFEDLMANIASKKKQPTSANMQDPFEILFNEYCDAPLMSMDDDPLMFWKEWSESGNPLKKKFSEVAVESLTPPGSSVEVERLFSTAGDAVPKDANRTKPENLEKKLFCHNNLPAVNFEY